MNPADRGLPRACRLLRPADFARVYGLRQSAAAGSLVVYAAPGEPPDGPARLGLSVSRRIGNAVVRNRWKRRLREAFRRARPALPAGTDIVVVVRGGAVPVGEAGVRSIAEALTTLVRRVTGRRGYAGAVSEERPAAGSDRGRRGRRR